VLERCWTLCSISSACSSSFSVSAFASAFKCANAADQLWDLEHVGLDTRLEEAELTADSDFQVGERSDPWATATGGVPLPTLRTLSLGGRSGDGALDGGRLWNRSDGGRGERGTLSKNSPSGISSPSSSSHSSSSSRAVFRSRFDCQLLLRVFIVAFESFADSDTPGLGLRCRMDVCEDRRLGPRNGRGLVYGSGRSPRLATRPLVVRIWLCRIGKVGLNLGRVDESDGRRVFEASREYCSRGVEDDTGLFVTARNSEENDGW
jgi:hypothetical protein